MDMDLGAYVDETRARWNLPALSVAIWAEGRAQAACSGLLSLDTRVEATASSLFQIGSVTKLFTAALVMQLVDDRLVDLDAPIKRYLRDFQIADTAATAAITVRQLLNHSSGIAGDFVPDDADAGGDLIARYVDRCNALPLIHAPGAHHSYCNAGYVILGRLVEVMRRTTWAAAVRHHLFFRLGLAHAIAEPWELIRHRAAIGHVRDGRTKSGWKTTPVPFSAPSLAPAGSTLMMSVLDLLRFGAAFMGDEPDGMSTALMSAAALGRMTAPDIAVPSTAATWREHRALGWAVVDDRDAGIRLLTHKGATIGQLSAVFVVPDRKVACSVLMNGDDMSALDAVSADLLGRLAGVTVAPTPLADGGIDTGRARALAGRYGTVGARFELSRKGDRLVLAFSPEVAGVAPERYDLRPLQGPGFAALTASGDRRWDVRFIGEDAPGGPLFLSRAGRLYPRLGPGEDS